MKLLKCALLASLFALFSVSANATLSNPELNKEYFVLAQPQQTDAVGKNGKLVILDADSGKIVSTMDVVKNSDQIAYDRKLKRLYIPGTGEIDVVQMSDDGGKLIGHVDNPKGCHSIAVDPKTHNVWIVYADDKNSYAQCLTAK